MRKYLKEEVYHLIQSANNDNQFTFNLNEYKDMNTNIHFHCNKCGHGFIRKPTVFIYRNNSCPYCNDKKRNVPYTTEEFILKSKELFNRDDWSYECTEYKGSDIPLKINCHKLDEFGKEHGIFEVSPHAHLSMHVGCKKCSNKYGDKDRFISLSQKLFNNFYSYDSITEYINANTKVPVTCPIHGDFLITPNDHLSGKGCSKCRQSHMEREIEQFLKDH